MTRQSQRQRGDPKVGSGHDWGPLALLALGLTTHFAYISTAPPGLLGDSARLGLHAVDWLRKGIWPVYVYHQASPNPLIVYLQGLAFVVFGFTRTALRGVTAFWGALAIPATYLACKELFHEEGPLLARRSGMLAAVGLGLLPFFSNFSRQGIESILLPAIELLAVASLWRGLRQRRWVDFVLSGAMIGLSQYAHIVGRVFPTALALACGIAILTRPKLLARWRGFALAAGTAALVALPQWAVFVYAPFTLVARTQGATQPFVLSMPNAGTVLGKKLLGQLSMIGWHWTTGYHPNSTRPLLTPMLFVGFLVAIGATFATRRAARVFGLALAGLLLVPDLAFYEGPSPTATRVIPFVPFLLVVAGLGCALLWRWLETRPSLPAWTALLVPAAVLVAGLESQWHFSARVLPKVYASPGLEWKNSLIEMAEAEYIAAHLDAAMLLPSSEYQRAPLAFLLAEQFPERNSGMPLPLAQAETIKVIAPAEPKRASTEGIPAGYRPDEWVLLKESVAYFLPPVPNAVEHLGDSQPIYASNGTLAAKVYRARWQGKPPLVQPFEASFTNGLDLVGYQTSELVAGDPYTVTLFWRPRHEIVADVQMVVQLLDRGGGKVAAVHDWPLREAYRVRAWQPHQTMPLSYRFEIPSDLQPGPYLVIAGPYDLMQQRRIRTLDGQEYARVTTAKIPLPPSKSRPARSIEAQFGTEIALKGYTLSPTAGGLDVTLYWEAQAPLETDYTVFVHLVDAGGQIVAQADAQPLGGQYPTSIWDPGETVADRHSVTAPPGEVQVYIGLYEWQTMQRLQVTAEGAIQPEGRLLLGVVKAP